MLKLYSGMLATAVALAVLVAPSGAQQFQKFYPYNQEYGTGWLDAGDPPTKNNFTIEWHNIYPDSVKRGWADFNLSGLSFTIDSAQLWYNEFYTYIRSDTEMVAIRWVTDSSIHPATRSASDLWNDLAGGWHVGSDTTRSGWHCVSFPSPVNWPATMKGHLLLGWLSDEEAGIVESFCKAYGYNATINRPYLKLFH